MKLTFILLQVGAVLGQAIIDGRWNGPPGCDSNNCARAVTGTRLGAAVVSAHVADCLSYQQVTTYFDCDSVASPTATPTYASACTEEANAYGSACSCWGYPVVTQTVWPAPPPPKGPPPKGPPPNGPPPNGPPPNGPPPNGPPPNGPPPNGPPPNGPPPKGSW